MDTKNLPFWRFGVYTLQMEFLGTFNGTSHFMLAMPGVGFSGSGFRVCWGLGVSPKTQPRAHGLNASTET